MWKGVPPIPGVDAVPLKKQAYAKLAERKGVSVEKLFQLWNEATPEESEEIIKELNYIVQRIPKWTSIQDKLRREARREEQRRINASSLPDDKRKVEVDEQRKRIAREQREGLLQASDQRRERSAAARQQHLKRAGLGQGPHAPPLDQSTEVGNEPVNEWLYDESTLLDQSTEVGHGPASEGQENQQCRGFFGRMLDTCLNSLRRGGGGKRKYHKKKSNRKISKRKLSKRKLYKCKLSKRKISKRKLSKRKVSQKRKIKIKKKSKQTKKTKRR